MPRTAPRTKPTQVESLRRGLEIARLLAEKPHRTEELAEAVDLDRRSVEILMAGLRDAGLEIETEVRDQRYRYHSLRVIPTWLARAVRALGRIGA
jgi:DNA-binding transcriptional ArsR family regulator